MSYSLKPSQEQPLFKDYLQTIQFIGEDEIYVFLVSYFGHAIYQKAFVCTVMREGEEIIKFVVRQVLRGEEYTLEKKRIEVNWLKKDLRCWLNSNNIKARIYKNITGLPSPFPCLLYTKISQIIRSNTTSESQ